MVEWLAGNRLRGTSTERTTTTVSTPPTISTDGNYTVLKYTEDGVFIPKGSFNVEYLVVGGGGGSGAGYTTWSGRGGGGGGAGGYLSGTGHGVTPQSYSITVGAGGTANNNGSNSVFSSFTSIGGGRGGQIAGNTSAVGGSGGGGSGGDNGSAGTSGQGNAGANGSGNGSGGAGGGGSNSAGSAGSVPTAGAGGSGTANDILITGSNVTYASGGAGGNSDSSGAGTAGGDNTGNGASGGSGDSGSAGASGGSGIVIIRFLTSGNYYLTTAEIFMPSLQSPSVGGWVEVGRTTLDSAGDTIDVSSLPDKRYYMVLTSDIADGIIDSRFRLGNGSVDTGSNYARRSSENGGAEVTGVGNDSLLIPYGENGNTHFFGVHYFANKSNKEKLLTGNCVDKYGSGAGYAPARFENTGKWSNTSDVIDVIRHYNAQSGSFDTGSEMVVLGWDTADTHTSNFWEELASVELSSASSELSSGTITAKKYLWIQCWSKRTGANDMRFRFNNDSGSNYANRKSSDGGTDATITSATSNSYLTLSGAKPSFLNMFVVNNASNEKLCIYHVVHNGTSGAGTAPNRQEWVGKWTNTSDQITEIDISPDGGNLDTGSILKVWGSD